MTSNIKRSYNSEGRKAQAKKTRNRILETAKSLFQTHGFEGVTIDAIALEAQVSTPTVYSLFQSKRGVLRALMDEALSSEEFESLVVQVKKEKTARGRLQVTAKIARQLYDAERLQMSIFRGASVLSPEFKDVEKEREDRRFKRQEETVESLFYEYALKPGMSLLKARDIMWTFTGRDIYRMFVIERGWSSDEYEEWLAQHLIDSLLAS